MAGPLDSVRVQRRRSRRRRLARRHPEQLHVFSFTHPAVAGGHRQALTVLVRGTMGQDAAIPLAGTQARARMPGAFCTDISTVPAPRPTPALDALTARLTAFPDRLRGGLLPLPERRSSRLGDFANGIRSFSLWATAPPGLAAGPVRLTDPAPSRTVSRPSQ